MLFQYPSRSSAPHTPQADRVGVGARCALARSMSRSRRPPVITPLLPPSRPAPAGHGEARSQNYPGRPGAAFCDSAPLPRNLWLRTLLASVTPATLPAVPGRGPSRAHTAPCGRDRSRCRQSPSSPGHTARLWPSLPQLAGHVNIRCTLPSSPQSLWVPKTCATCADAPSERRRLGRVSGTRLAGPGLAGRAMIVGLWA
jgi:hypothetical protein